MADENKPAFYPRVGNIKAKNFKPAQPMPFIDDERAMELPQYSEFIPKLGTVDLSVPSKQNLELNKRITQRDADLMRQVQADRSPLEKLAGGVQAGRFLGSAMTQGINSIPTRLFKGDEAADKFMEERIYKPEQPLAYEYAQDVGDFLDKLETEYKIPPLMPEALPLQHLSSPATSQAMRTAGRGAEQVGRKLESAMEPVVKGALERGGLPREMVMAMGANTQSNVMKPYGGNWLGGGEQLGIPENDLRRLKGSTEPRLTHINEQGQAVGPEYGRQMTEEELQALKSDPFYATNRAVNNWIDSNLKNYVKKEMGTPDDPVRKLAEQGITHMPLRDDLDRMEYLQAMRKAEGFPAEGMGQSPLAKQWENLTDDSIRVTKAGKIQEAADISDKVLQARIKMDAYTKELDKNFLARMADHTGKEIFSPKEAEMLMKMPDIQKAEILGDTKYKELKENLYQLMAREQGFEKRAGELNPFVSKLDPETRLYSGGVYNLGFDHIVDVLKEDVASGRIRPEQLNKVSMEQAVRRTYEYDQEMARKMNEARMTSRAELPVYKEYPEGLKWVQLTRPSDFAAESDAMGHSARGYEPPKGHPDWVEGSGAEGHSSYGLGGWEAIKSGRAKVYSLVDAKGEPHVTIETGKSQYAPRHEQVLQYKSAAEQEAKQLPNGYTDADVYDIATRMAKENMPYFVNQIKGKQNAKPKADYLPFVQDFVRGNKWSDVRDFQNTGLIREGGQFMTPAEHADWLLKELGADTYNELGLGAKPPPAAGMKAGGKVSISNNPDTMMLAVNNQKMKNGEPAYAGGKLIVGKGLKAAKPPKIEVPRLSMQFGNDLPINMNTAEVENLARRFPEPTVDRVNMAHKDVLKRTPELQEAAARIEAGDISADEYARLVQRYKPVTPYESVPAPASREEILAALSKTSREAEGLPRKETYFGKPSSTLKEGDPVGLRLDIPSYNQANTWVVTAHGPRKSPVSGGAGTRIGYEPVAMATDVDFSVSPKAALGIAKGAEKNTIATMEGKWKPTSSDEAFTLAKQYLKNPEWRQVGMDPERHSFFYDRETMAPVVNAEEVIQIGPLVLAKNPKFGKLEDFKYAGGGLTGGIKQGLKVAKPPKLEVPIRFPVSRGPTVPEIRAMAERMAPQVMGEFVREAPTASKPNPSANVVGKSKKQFDREKNLQIGYQDIKPPVTPQEFDYAAHKDDLLIGAAGDVTPANRMLLSIDNQPLSHAVHQQGGPEWALYNPSGWAATDEMAKTWMKRADKAAEAYGAQPHLHYHKMTPDANWYAMHHLHSLLGHMRPDELKFKNPELYAKMVEEIRGKDVGFGKHPEFEGFDDPLNLNIHAQIDPHFRRHLGKVLGSPTFAERYGLNSGVDVMAATSLPDLRDLEVGSSGYAVVPLDTKAPLQHFAADSQTYDTGFPMKGEPKRSKYPSPYELIYRDTLNWMKAHPSENKSSEFGRMNMIVPKQQIDNELIEAIGEYQRRMKELTGKKKGGAVKKEGGEIQKPAAKIDGNEFVLAAQKYGIKDSMNNLNKIVDLVNKGYTVDDAARQVADTGMHKAAGGAIRGDDLILEERPL